MGFGLGLGSCSSGFSPRALIRLLVVACAFLPATARGDAFTDYTFVGSFDLPPGGGTFDILADGRLVTLVGPTVLAETAVGSRVFGPIGTLAGADISSYGPAFVRVSSDGLHLAIGNGGGAAFNNFEVGVFDIATLGGNWFAAAHFDAAWIDGANLALTTGVPGSPSIVTVLDSLSAAPANPTNTMVIDEIGGASGGITFDAVGGLYTGNGYSAGGPSTTGAVKHFDEAAWTAALAGGEPIDFEDEGTLIVDVLSAAALGFDDEGNLHIGGGDFATGEMDFAALVRASAVVDAILGNGPADILDPESVRWFDPDADNPYNYYDVNFNDVTGELYFREGTSVYTYAVPEPFTVCLMLAGIAAGAGCGRSYRRSVS